MSTSSANNPQPDTANSDDRRKCKYQPPEKEKRVWGMTIFERIMAALTFFAVLFAGGTGFVIYWQVQEMRTDQRAWVGFAEIKEFTLEPNQPFVMKIAVSNVGKTPAQNLGIGFRVITEPKGAKPTDYDSVVDPLLGHRSALFLPGETHILFGDIHQGSTNALSEDIVNQIKRGDIMLFAIGKATYRDIFGKEHWTHYCWSSEIKPIQGLVFRACPDFNEIDKEQE